jgi:hypothetical protein
MFTVVGTIALCVLLGGYAAAGSNALILFYLVAAGSAAPVSVIPDRLKGVALGGGLALAAAVLLWPEPEHPQTLRQLGAALRDLAARVARLASGAIDELAPRVAPPGPRIRATVDALVDRPAAPTAAERAELYLIYDIERLDGLVTRLEETSGPQSADSPILQRCVSTISRCGEALSAAGAASGSELGPEAEPVTGVSFSLAARLAR